MSTPPALTEEAAAIAAEVRSHGGPEACSSWCDNGVNHTMPMMLNRLMSNVASWRVQWFFEGASTSDDTDDSYEIYLMLRPDITPVEALSVASDMTTCFRYDDWDWGDVYHDDRDPQGIAIRLFVEPLEQEADA